MTKSKIEWTDETWNPIRARNITTGGVGHYCVHVSDGCKNCYAERLQPRFKNPIRYAAQDRAKVEIYLDEKVLQAPLHWKKPRMIFVCSMTDLFGDWVPYEWLDRIFAVMALCQQHTMQLLTKRPERMREYFTYDDGFGRWGYIEHRARQMANIPDAKTLAYWGGKNLPNVWLGTSVEDQKTADTRIPHLLATPAAVRFISAEPLLGNIFIGGYLEEDTHCTNCGEPPMPFGDCCATPKIVTDPGLDWVIVGGESGANARPMHPDWARSLRDQCASADVPFFFKQWGEWAPPEVWDTGGDDRWKFDKRKIPIGHRYDTHIFDENTDESVDVWRVGKHTAGRLLDGREHNDMPNALEKVNG